ncbi:hypothetical protein NMG60_11001459 [Bertholletia excelsa]
MGCGPSKLFRKDLRQETTILARNCSPTHVVSLTSSTYGLLNLDEENQKKIVMEVMTEAKNRSPPRFEPEVINAWELMEDLEDGEPIPYQSKKSPKSRAFLSGFNDMESRSPLKFFNRMASPKRMKKFSGKENRERLESSPKFTPKSCILMENSRTNTPDSRISTKESAIRHGSRMDLGVLKQRKVLSPLFDPELIAFFEKELSQEEEEQIKKIVSTTPLAHSGKYSANSTTTHQQFEEKCPPGGENSVVIYTTTLRGIRKTFEDCNKVRSIIESHRVQVVERDVSMDSGFREELRRLMGRKEVKVPAVFVKGRLIGGAEETGRLEEEGKLGILLQGIPAVMAGVCKGCGGVRFVMCMECDGSCRVVGEDGKKTMRCKECNENGLIQCPICG